MGNSFKAWINSNNLVLIIIILYFLISVIKLEHPGVNNDQLMFVNTATFNPDNPFLWKSWHGIPTMVFPYIGALKSYLYMPIFYFFGVNIPSIRLPQIILISISLYLLYKSMNLAFGDKTALLIVTFLAIDASLIAYSRVDNGPTVIEFFLKILAIYLFFLYLKTRKGIFLISIYPVLGLGIFNKIIFFWFVNAFMISFLIFYLRSFYNDFKSYGKYFLLSFIALILVPYYLLLRLFIRLSKETALSYKDFSNEISLSNILNNFPIFYKNSEEVINGNIFFSKVYGYNPTDLGSYVWALIFLILLIGTFFIIKYRSSIIRPYLFFLSITFLISVQILLTKRAVFAWHALFVYPFLSILFAAGILQVYRMIKVKTIKLLLMFLVAVVIFYQIFINLLYVRQYSQPTKSISWSSSIYEVVDFAKDRKTIFVCLDIDICNSLLALTQQTGKYREPFGFLNPETYAASFDSIRDYFENSEFLYVAHGPTTTHKPEFREDFFNYIKEQGINLKKIKEFKDGETVTFEIYRSYNQNKLQ